MNTQEAIITRKSVRGFTKEQLTEKELKNILDAAYASPIAGGAHRTMRLTVVQDTEVLTQISDYYKEAGGMKADMLFGAPTLIIVSGLKTFDDTALFANAGCIVENIQLSAWDMGLGSVFNWSAGTALPGNGELLRALGISEDFKPLTGVVIGHPAKEVPKRELKMTIETNFVR
ncbi:MAG: nitroreductase family protein [Lachnospiraceae bacterium]|nr:nitroreductase family protein [Lachnospiraceae bacterium]